MNNPAARRRFRVVARPKAQARRVRVFAAFAVVLMLGAIAFVTVRKLASEFRMPALSASAVEAAVIVEGPEPLRTLAQAAADAVPGTAGDKAEALKAKFP